MSSTITLSKDETQVRLIATQDLTFAQAADIQAGLLAGVEAGDGKPVILDLTGIQQVDSTGIKLVLGLYKSCQDKNLPLTVEVASPSVSKLFQVCKLNKFIEVKEVAAHE